MVVEKNINCPVTPVMIYWLMHLYTNRKLKTIFFLKVKLPAMWLYPSKGKLKLWPVLRIRKQEAVFKLLTGDSWNQFKGTKHSDCPQSPQVHWDVHVSSCCCQDPKEEDTSDHRQTHTCRRWRDRELSPSSWCTWMWFYAFKNLRGDDSQTYKHTRTIAHSVGGWLQCLDMKCEDVRVCSRQRKQQGCIWGFWLFPCVGGRLWQLLFRRRTKKAARWGEGRTPLGQREMELIDENMRGHTQTQEAFTSFF